MANVKLKIPPRPPRKKRRRDGNRDTWQDTDKNQMHLGIGSTSYEEYRRDQMGLEKDDFVQDDHRMDLGDERTPDEIQEAPPEPVHTAEFAKTLRDAAQKQRNQDFATQQLKYRKQTRKKLAFGDIKKEAVAAAAKTETKEDDKIAARMRLRDVSDLVFDDGVTDRDYEDGVLEHYFGGL